MREISSYDYAFLGSGASTCIHLLSHGDYFKNKKVLILEKAAAFDQQKTFCSFVSDQNISAFATKSWSRWWVTTSNGLELREGRKSCYQYVSAKYFFESFQEKVQSWSSLNIRFGQEVQSLKALAQGFEIKTDKTSFVSDFIFDSRMPQGLKKSDPLLQHFLGLEYSFEKAHPFKEPVIMDLDSEYDSGLKFFYLIPTSETELLVEITYFDRSRRSEADYQREVEAYLLKKILKPIKTIRKEFGCIPLIEVDNQINEASYVALGARAGNLRPSTGYSFARSERLSAKELKPRKVHLSPRWKFLLWMDRVLLCLFDDRQFKMADFFKSFWARLSPDTAASFLGPEPSLISILVVVLRMPKLILIKTALKTRKASNNYYALRDIDD
jgi:lycopene beta-cyclase